MEKLPDQIISVIIDFLDRYIEDRRQHEWGIKEYLTNTHKAKMKTVETLKTDLNAINTEESKLFEFIYTLGKQAEEDKASAPTGNSLLFWVLHAIRSRLVDYVRKNLKTDYETIVKSLRAEYKHEKAIIVQQRKSNSITSKLDERQNERILKLCWLEDEETILSDKARVLVTLPSTEKHDTKMPTGKTLLSNYPVYLQPQLYRSFYAVGIAEEYVSYDNYENDKEKKYHLCHQSKKSPSNSEAIERQYSYNSILYTVTNELEKYNNQAEVSYTQSAMQTAKSVASYFPGLGAFSRKQKSTTALDENPDQTPLTPPPSPTLGLTENT